MVGRDGRFGVSFNRIDNAQPCGFRASLTRRRAGCGVENSILRRYEPGLSRRAHRLVVPEHGGNQPACGAAPFVHVTACCPRLQCGEASGAGPPAAADR